MITESQKNEIDKKYFPNGFFYVVKTFDADKKTRRLNQPFESLELYETNIKNVRHSHALHFFNHLKQLNESDFIKEINNQFLNYTIENFENAELWLRLTYDLVLKGFDIAGKIENITSRGLFIEWYDLKIKEVAPKQLINNSKTETLALIKEKLMCETFCKTMPLNIPKEHFEILTTSLSRDKKPFLTKLQYNDFIDRAFLGKTDLPKQKINIAPKGEKLKVQYLFRQFYENYCLDYFNTGQSQDVFIKLLTDNFIGWEFKNVHGNFNKKPLKTL